MRDVAGGGRVGDLRSSEGKYSPSLVLTGDSSTGDGSISCIAARASVDREVWVGLGAIEDSPTNECFSFAGSGKCSC